MARKFIIEDQGVYLVCEAKLEYSQESAKTSEEQQGVEEIAAMYTDAQKRGACLSACEIMDDMSTASPLNTGPRD